MFDKTPLPEEFKKNSLVYSSPGSLITPRILEKFRNRFGHAYWDQEKLFDEKVPNAKNLVTLSLLASTC
jgi:phosphatidate phosphatase APP1